MKIKHLYLILAILGTIGPYYYIFQFGQIHGMDLGLMVQQAFSTPGGRIFSVDLLVAATAYMVFLIVDSRKRKVPNLWLPIVGTFLIGTSFGLPMYLYLRELSSSKDA